MKVKVTLKDLEDVMKQYRASGEEELSSEIKALSAELCNMIIETPYSRELFDATIKLVLKLAKKGDEDAEWVLLKVAQLSGYATLAIGFSLGLREAGLSMGIGEPVDKKVGN
jgi:ABC-type transport system involved in cytochrome bd biosynthesis fused ATPase/permease subunit